MSQYANNVVLFSLEKIKKRQDEVESLLTSPEKPENVEETQMNSESMEEGEEFKTEGGGMEGEGGKANSDNGEASE